MKIGWLNKEYIQLFQERLSEKVYATIPKGIVGDFKFTQFSRPEISKNCTRGLGMFVSSKGKQEKK